MALLLVRSDPLLRPDRRDRPAPPLPPRPRRLRRRCTRPASWSVCSVSE